MGSKQGRMKSGKCNPQAVKRVDGIGRSRDERTSVSVYISDAERDILLRTGGTKNLSKAIQHVAYLLGLIRRE